MSQKGFHPYSESKDAPFQPADLIIPKYALLSTYGRMELEEVAARYIIACQEAGAWMGVELGLIVEKAHEEWMQWAKAQSNNAQVYENNLDESIRFRKANALWTLKCLLTFGLYALFGKKPNPPVYQEMQPGPRIMSGVFMVGPQFLMIGFQELEDRGYIDIEDRDGVQVAFPTRNFYGPIQKYVRPKGSPTSTVN